jgi:prepilin-type processing-associated H-X9-DG protein/prepilin-type N-terminal cleavage/methylation domain-containing protein
MTRRAFTLIESLVAVAVIAALMGILLPTLGAARDASRSAVCLSNARQLSVANAAYAAEHMGRSVPAAARIQSQNLHRWHGTRSSADEPFDPGRGDLTQYLGSAASSEGVRACPEFRPTLAHLRESGAGFESGAGGYGYNAAFVGVQRVEATPGLWSINTDEKGARRDRFRRPTETIEFGDAAFAADASLIEYSFLEPSVWPDYPDYRPDPSMHFRHAGKANVAWLDGHASGHAMTNTNWSGLYATDPESLGIGWFGPDDSNQLFDYE